MISKITIISNTDLDIDIFTLSVLSSRFVLYGMTDFSYVCHCELSYILFIADQKKQWWSVNKYIFSIQSRNSWMWLACVVVSVLAVYFWWDLEWEIAQDTIVSPSTRSLYLVLVLPLYCISILLFNRRVGISSRQIYTTT